MQINALPSRMPTPFADSGTKNTIPVASQVGVTAGLASYTTGFPPLTMTPIAAGGVPPQGADFNGILNAVTQAVRWANAGMSYPFDAGFATSISGYPVGALLPNSSFSGFWLNTSDQNTKSPEPNDNSLTGWVPVLGYGVTTLALASSSVTLTTLQASKERIILTGSLGANVTIYLPAWMRKWTIINNTLSLSYNVTVSTTGGVGVVIPRQLTTEIYGDGTNILLGGVLPVGVIQAGDTENDSSSVVSSSWIRGAMSSIATKAGFSASFGTNGWFKSPSWLGGWILEWGYLTTTGGSTATASFPIAFPNACYQAVCSHDGPDVTAANGIITAISFTNTQVTVGGRSVAGGTGGVIGVRYLAVGR